MSQMLEPLSELSEVVRTSALRGLKADWEEEMTIEDKKGFLAAGGLEYCLAAGIPKEELDALQTQNSERITKAGK